MEKEAGQTLIEARPSLSADMKIADLRNYYWLKEELVVFARQLGISANGKKLEILARIEIFLNTGQTGKPEVRQEDAARTIRKQKKRDSDAPLTLDTPMINFKSDQATRQFFESVIGPHFHFTAHMGDFMREHEGTTLTYGDLVREWEAEHERRKNATYRPPIMKSCEYNQFIRDFFADEQNRGKKLGDAIAAWNEVKHKPGARIYTRSE